VWPEFFEPVLSGVKTFEVRLNDRDYHAGDQLVLGEFDPRMQAYTGRSRRYLVTYVGALDRLAPGFKDHVGMSLEAVPDGTDLYAALEQCHAAFQGLLQKEANTPEFWLNLLDQQLIDARKHVGAGQLEKYAAEWADVFSIGWQAIRCLGIDPEPFIVKRLRTRIIPKAAELAERDRAGNGYKAVLHNAAGSADCKCQPGRGVRYDILGSAEDCPLHGTGVRAPMSLPLAPPDAPALKDVSCEHGKRWIRSADGWMNVVKMVPDCGCEAPGGHTPTGWRGVHAFCAVCKVDICEGMELGTKRPFDAYEFDGRCFACDEKIGPWTTDELEEAVNQGILAVNDAGQYVDPLDLDDNDSYDDMEG
jgi:hypothetical protein